MGKCSRCDGTGVVYTTLFVARYGTSPEGYVDCPVCCAGDNWGNEDPEDDLQRAKRVLREIYLVLHPAPDTDDTEEGVEERIEAILSGVPDLCSEE